MNEQDPQPLDNLVEELRALVQAGLLPDALDQGDLVRRFATCGARAIASLAALLDDPVPAVSEAARDLRGRLANPGNCDAIARYALQHLQDPHGSSKLPGPGWHLLVELGPAVLPALASLYASQDRFEQRLALIHLAQQIGGPEALPLVQTALDSAIADREPALGQAAAEALGHTGSELAYVRLVDLLGSDDVPLRSGAIEGLRALGDPRAVRPLLGVLLQADHVIEQWEPGALGGRKTLRSQAARAIDRLTGKPLAGGVARTREWLRGQSVLGSVAST